MKNTQLIIAISELWTDTQRSCVKNCLLRGIEEINKKFDINDIIEELNSKNVENEIDLETCKVLTLIDIDKQTFLQAVKNGRCHERLFIIYVGPVSVPWGHWLLRDAIVSAGDVIQLMENAQCKLVMSTLAPCDDWLAAEKKHPDTVCVCNYDITECGDPIALGLCDFIDSVCRTLKVTTCDIKKPDTSSFLKIVRPTVCGFSNQGSSTTPCMVLIDGFSMVFNLGYGRNPEMRHHLKYIAQADAVLLSHLGYSNILPLSCNSQNPDSVNISHLFLPYGAACDEKDCVGDSDNPYVVDLNNEIGRLLSGYKDKGTSVSNIAIKGKSASPVAANQLKPIQLFHKIGYGSLDLIPLAPFEDDPDVKKCCEDLKKGKYVNESVVRPLPSSVSVLLLWRPFNGKMPTKRFLYIGPRSQLKKNLPAVASALYSNYDCLKQPDYGQWEASNKKPITRKVQTAVTNTNKVNDANLQAGKKGAPQTNVEKPTKTPPVTDNAKKTTVNTTAPHVPSNKSPRPSTAVVATSQPKPKESQVTKRATTAPGKTKTDVTKNMDTKKTTSKVAATSHPVTGAKTTVTKKVTANVADHNDEALHVDAPILVNGLDENGDVDHNGEVAHDSGKLVAVGTVESAITEHGEADFCDDTPEELSAEQMKEMGLYAEDDEERSSAPLSDGEAFGGQAQCGVTGSNLAHLPMEGSFYGKDTFDEIKDHPNNWQQPMGMPAPTRDTSGGRGNKTTKCATPVHVDCVCVPSDLEKEDLRCLFHHVRFTTAFLHLDKCNDVIRCLEVLMEEWGVDGAGREATVVPSIDDEASVTWLLENQARLTACKVKVGAALSRCSIKLAGTETECLGLRCEL